MIVIIMGVEGAGKTTIGSLLAHRLGFEFHDADAFHSPANIAKMRAGIALTDSDREPWLEAIHAALLQWLSEGCNIVLACSALKESYRQKLVINQDVRLVYLKATYVVIMDRLKARTGHFAGQQLLSGQFADLEEPADAIVVDASLPPQQIVQAVRVQLCPDQPLKGHS